MIGAVEAMCDDRFCLLGVSGPTDAVAPLVIVNGPIRRALDINAGAGVFGPGWRANATIGRAVRLCWVTLVFSPEHAKTLADDGWSKAQARQFLWQRLRKPVRDLAPGREGGEGLCDEMLATLPDGTPSETLLPKFQTPESLQLLIAGGTAGRFTAIVPGCPFRDAPCRLVFRKIG